MNDVQIISFAGAIPHNTSGSQVVTITGRNFGPTSWKLQNVPGTNPATVSATYGLTGVEYAAENCAIIVQNTAVECTTKPGVGKDLLWTITVDGDSAVSTQMTRYHTPVIHEVLGADNLATKGGTLVTLKGLNFGPLNSPVVVQYTDNTGTLYSATECAVTVAHVEVQCKSAPGIGFQLMWRIMVKDQWSDPKPTASGYAPPSIDYLEGALVMNTTGGQEVFIVGENFGMMECALLFTQRLAHKTSL